jgi:hypothetical protein
VYYRLPFCTVWKWVPLYLLEYCSFTLPRWYVLLLCILYYFSEMHLAILRAVQGDTLPERKEKKQRHQ